MACVTNISPLSSATVTKLSNLCIYQIFFRSDMSSSYSFKTTLTDPMRIAQPTAMLMPSQDGHVRTELEHLDLPRSGEAGVELWGRALVSPYGRKSP